MRSDGDHRLARMARSSRRRDRRIWEPAREPTSARSSPKSLDWDSPMCWKKSATHAWAMANASGGSTTAASPALAVKDAAFNARVAMAARVAPLLGVAAEAIVFDDAESRAADKSLTWRQRARCPAVGLVRARRLETRPFRKRTLTGASLR